MTMFHEDTSKGGLVLSPKAGFILGLVGGAMLLCTIGFFILLAGVLGGKLGTKSSEKAVAAAPSAAAPTPTAPQPAPAQGVGEVAPVTDKDHVQGPADAPVTLVEYSDLQCPFCSRFHPTMQQVMKEYKGKVRWVYRHFPLSFHPNAVPAANAAECASEQGKFWEFIDKVFSNNSAVNAAGFDTSLLSQWAGEIGLNKSKFDACFKASKYSSVISADQASGSAAGVDGTPATIIIGKDGSKKLIPGALPFEAVKPMLDEALK